MRRDEVVIVPGTVEVDGEKIDAVEAILLAVGLKLNKEHLLGQPIGSIGLLGVTVPQILLFEGDWGELGVRADGTYLNKFFDSMKPCFFDQLNAHDGVVIEEGTRVQPVGSNTAYNGCKVDDDLGMQVVKHALYVDTITEIVVMINKWNDVCRAMFLQFLDKVTAKETPSTRDNNLFRGEVKHTYFISFRMLSPV
jgi:hypothetical protein